MKGYEKQENEHEVERKQLAVLLCYFFAALTLAHRAF